MSRRIQLFPTRITWPETGWSGVGDVQKVALPGGWILRAMGLRVRILGTQFFCILVRIQLSEEVLLVFPPKYLLSLSTLAHF